MVDQKRLARLPKVDHLLEHPVLLDVRQEVPRPLVLAAARQALDDLRARLLAGEDIAPEDLAAGSVAQAVAGLARRLAAPSLQRVVNATGVVVHTNLGRSILARRALERLIEINRTYSNLEYDLDAGARGSRYAHVDRILCELTGAEASLVVNNNAAAVLLSLQTLAAGREVVVSRGQLVEIGGSFRIPDVMARSGAVLREVGATNKTHLRDYEGAITSNTALLLKVHTSNFAVVGFHQEVPLKELRELGDRYHLPVMEDLGSGSLVDYSRFGLPKEPTVQEALADGADLVTFSGDKLLGGPQAGIILGKAEFVERCRKNPTNRALRVDKLTLAALEATLELYREPEKAMAEIPTLAMITAPYERLRERANRLAGRLKALGLERLEVSTVEGMSRVGGGAMPLAAPRTRLLQVAIKDLSPTRLEQALRAGNPPVICRLEDGHLLMDVRTMMADDAAVIVKALTALAA
ncbi:MAG: L-seryl-tRNA(Sec) selenium transferase [Proteobacteria bacterium]|nr:L-seryl-tRNA(Sec) selenium transferase [Pseudomonadota bacterium]MBU1451099.1 L-seryl-tRNA(Sec) selenium transferase [Pseudomonadota bacterium]